MFEWLGHFVTRYWLLCLAGWAAIFVAAYTTAPAWSEVSVDGELNHLPSEMPTRRGERMYKEAFPDDIANSSVVLVLHREEGELGQKDWKFIRGPLTEGLQDVAESHGGLVGETLARRVVPHELANVVEAVASHGGELPEGLEWLAREPPEAADLRDEPQIVSIEGPDTPVIGRMLLSSDGQAALVNVSLTSNFLETRNEEIVGEIADLVDRLRQQGQIPEGLQVDLSGSATVGVSTIREVTRSTDAVSRWAVWIAVCLLFVVFRAPLAALLPLVTMYVSVEVTLGILAWAARYDLVSVFDGLPLYVTVLVYGAGVDYSLFILARQQEEMQAGRSTAEGVRRSLSSVGVAVAASAGTEIVGIGLLRSAEFGKFQQAAIGVSLGLAVLLAASLTLTPSVLFLARRWTFFPQLSEKKNWLRRLSLDAFSERIWRSLASVQRRWPAIVLVSATAILTPMAVVGLLNLDRLSYGLLAGLPEKSLGIQGINVLRKHYEPGLTGPITLLLHDRGRDFSSPEGIRLIETLGDRLRRRSQSLEIAEIRSLSDPLGSGKTAREVIAELAERIPVKTFLDRGELVIADATELRPGERLFQAVVRELAYEHYVSHTTDYDGTVTRITIVPDNDPFRLASIRNMDRMEATIRHVLPEELADAEVYLLGTTASLRDVRDVARTDWKRIRVVIPLGVLVVLVLLLRRPIVSTYLVLTVIFSFLVTYGVTFSVFWAYEGSSFAGLDWTVPVLLFTLLVAIGEDYSVLLVTRTEEERRNHSPTRGVTEALVKTGGLISGAGLIMAGTFSALWIGGTLASMHQLGFALCFGTLLDTFIVRPVLVPSFLDLMARWKMGRRRRRERGKEHEGQPKGSR